MIKTGNIYNVGVAPKRGVIFWRGQGGRSPLLNNNGR